MSSHARWLTHNRSIKIPDLVKMRLEVSDYSGNLDLNDAITRYYTLLRMTFDSHGIYKIIETPNSRIEKEFKTSSPANSGTPLLGPLTDEMIVELPCTCGQKIRLQLNFGTHKDTKPGLVPFPVQTNNLTCPHCGADQNLLSMRQVVEGQTGKKLVE